MPKIDLEEIQKRLDSEALVALPCPKTSRIRPGPIKPMTKREAKIAYDTAQIGKIKLLLESE